MDREDSIEAAEEGAVVAFVICGFHTFLTAYALVSENERLVFYDNPYNFIVSPILFICAFALRRCSRIAAITAFAWHLFATVMQIYMVGPPSLLPAVVILGIFYYLGKAILGAIRYHKIEKEENPREI